MMDNIIFVSPIQNIDGQLHFGYTLGASYIRAYLKSNGVSSEQYVSSGYLSLEDAANNVLKMKPKYVCFYCMDTTYYFVKLMRQSHF